jgi:hypothetical protein
MSATKESRRKPETKIPESFPGERDNAAAAAMAERAGVTLDLIREAFRFRNHAEQNDRRCRDWSAAWRNWIDKAIERASKALATVVAAEASDDWRVRVRGYRANGYWRVREWGPKPEKPDCRAPAALLTEFGLGGPAHLTGLPAASPQRSLGESDLFES